MVLTPTRRPVTGRIVARLRCAYIRWLLRCAEQDLAQDQAELERASRRLPEQIKHHRKHIDALTRQLVREDRNT